MEGSAGDAGPRGPTPGVEPGTLSALLLEIARGPDDRLGEAWGPALHTGSVVGRFELVRELGRGGFGVVWEAKDRELGRLVAFKAVRAGGKAGLREERLLREAEAAARLSHPNIVTLFDVGRSEQGPYLVLELLRGRTLSERLAEGPLPLREATSVATEVAKGLAHAHASGVVHRDLKPGNVFLCQDGQVKVLDFGLAHAFGRRCQDGGTPAYMAPEQMAGAPEDERSDVFALGVILFEMLSGKLPFPDAKALSSSGKAPLLETPAAPALGELVGRMLAKEPVARPRDGGAVEEALSSIREALAPAGPSPAPVRVRRRLPRLAVMGLLAALLGTALAGVLVYYPRLRPPPAPPSVAVLAFADMSPQHDQEYFADGIAEEILNALAQVEGLHVCGRTSSFSFKGKSEDLRSIGQKLGVATVLEGSVRKEGNRVRITAQVVNVADGYHLWRETFDRELSGVFAIQDEIARAVTEALKPKLMPGKEGVAAGPRAANLEAYNHYLLGREIQRRGASEENFRRAREAFDRAIRSDAAYAPAWAGLAYALFFLAEYSEDSTAIAAMKREAMAAADQAVARGPRLPDGYVIRSRIRQTLRWDWTGAQADLEKAMALNPGDAGTQRSFGHLHKLLGRPSEALTYLLRAVALDPLDGAAPLILCGAYANADRLDLARQACERALELSPDSAYARHNLGRVFLLQGQLAEALAAFERNRDDALRLTGVALAQFSLGRLRESDKALADLTSRWPHGAAYQIAYVHAWRGEMDRAFEWLDRAYRQQDVGLIYVKSDPLLRPLRRDPRYTALLRKINLPVD